MSHSRTDQEQKYILVNGYTGEERHLTGTEYLEALNEPSPYVLVDFFTGKRKYCSKQNYDYVIEKYFVDGMGEFHGKYYTTPQKFEKSKPVFRNKETLTQLPPNYDIEVSITREPYSGKYSIHYANYKGGEVVSKEEYESLQYEKQLERLEQIEQNESKNESIFAKPTTLFTSHKSKPKNTINLTNKDATQKFKKT